MLRIKRLDIIEEKCELLYKADFTQENFEKDFEIARGTWTAKDGLLVGYMEEDGGGLVYSYKHFLGDVMIDFYGKILAPYDNDMNFTFCSDGWNYEKGKPNDGYVGGLQGWWIGKCGIEKYPLDSNVEALAMLKDFDKDKEYHVQAGRIGKRLFLFVDGELIVELLDTNPLEKCGRVGLGVYASKIQFRDFKVFKPYTVPFDASYQEMRKK
jgi:hypothetical protein